MYNIIRSRLCKRRTDCDNYQVEKVGNEGWRSQSKRGKRARSYEKQTSDFEQDMQGVNRPYFTQLFYYASTTDNHVASSICNNAGGRPTKVRTRSFNSFNQRPKKFCDSQREYFSSLFHLLEDRGGTVLEAKKKLRSPLCAKIDLQR